MFIAEMQDEEDEDIGGEVEASNVPELKQEVHSSILLDHELDAIARTQLQDDMEQLAETDTPKMRPLTSSPSCFI